MSMGTEGPELSGATQVSIEIRKTKDIRNTTMRNTSEQQLTKLALRSGEYSNHVFWTATTTNHTKAIAKP